MVTPTKRRSFISSVATAGTLCLAGCIGSGSNGSELTVVVPFGAGGATDTQFRMVEEYFENELDRSVVVDNRPGASGREGFNHLSRQDPDGSTVGVISSATAVIGEESFDTQYSMSELTPIGTIATEYFSFINQPGVYESMNDLAETEDEVLAASTGAGASSDFALTTILDTLGLEFNIVPFESGGEVSTAVASGDVDLGVVPPTSADGMVEEEQVEFLYINRPDQSSRYPDVPTQEDVDFDLPEISLSLGMFGPGGMEDDQIDELSSALVSAASGSDFEDAATQQGLTPIAVGPDETNEIVEEYRELAQTYNDIRDLQ